MSFVITHLPNGMIPRGSILAITSKICSLAEGRTHTKENTDKHDLARQDAEIVIGDVGYGSLLTVTRGVMILSAGIDESNSPEGTYILYPKSPPATLKSLFDQLVLHCGHTEFGLIMTDSRSAPLRNGVSGVALACCGFQGLQSRVGDLDLFGRPLKSTKVNIADSLAAAAVVMMGEANESQPLALITGAKVSFIPSDTTLDIAMLYDDDLYLPLLAALKNAPEKIGI